MNTDYSVGNIRIRFESRARRRWFVALVYAVLAVFVLAGFSVSTKTATATWVSVGCMVLFVMLFIVFTWVAGDMCARGDEREMHRRDHAHFRAYRFFSYVLVAGLFLSCFSTPYPIPSILPPVLRAFLAQLPHLLLIAAFLLYVTLPRAILL
jgi:hypothetical protein